MKKIDESFLLSSLNEVQLKAALHIEGPSLILAGAGSGKTRVVAYKMCHMISHHRVPSDRIMAVTFTNKAANEMKARVGNILEHNIPLPWVGTFHSICVKILRRILPPANPMRPEPGLFRNFSIFDDDDQKKLINQLLKARSAKGELFEPDLRTIKGRISNWKNQFIDPLDAQEKAYYMEDKFAAEVYEEYQAHLKRNNALDFDDLMCETVRILKREEAIRKDLNQWFLKFFVDEYQDTNQVQLKLIQLLTAGTKSPDITVVGDDDQSIYAWRGADLRIIRNFHSHFENVEIFKLEQNYRSTSNIVAGAGSLIAHNAREKQYEKNVFSKKEEGDLIKFFKVTDERAEAEKVTDQIADRGEDLYGQTAVLYRTNAQSRVLEEYFHRKNIPCRIVGGTSFFQRKEIKDVFAYLKVMINPTDSVSLRRIINTPKRGIGDATVDKLMELAAAKQITLFEALQFGDEVLGKGPATKVDRFYNLLNTLQYSPEILLSNYVERIVESSGLLLQYEEGKEADPDKVANLEELITSVVEIEEQYPGITLEEYLQQMALQTSADQKGVEGAAVQLMTLHSAKGLEFPEVYITGCSEGMLPMGRGLEDDKLEEERRLMYVGMTRAENRLYLMHSKYRKVRGRDEVFQSSRFIKEIDPEVLHTEDLQEFTSSLWQENWSYQSQDYFERRRGNHQGRGGGIPAHRENAKPKERDLDFDQGPSYDEFSQEESYLEIGSSVHHQKFGFGTVRALDGEGENAKITVLFQSGSEKKLLLKFANLKVVSP